MNVMLALISGLEPVAGLLFQWIDSDDAYSYKTTWFTIERDYINEDPILPLYRSEILEHIKLSSAYGKALDTHGLWFTRWPDGSFLYDVYNLSWSGAAIVTTPGNTSASSLPSNGYNTTLEVSYWESSVTTSEHFLIFNELP